MARYCQFSGTYEFTDTVEALHTEMLGPILANIAPAAPLLPVSHSTSLVSFEAAVTAGALLPRPCKVFGKDLVYTYYGPPAYRRRSMSITDRTHLPAALVFAPGVYQQAALAYPFDTGAFKEGLFHTYFAEAMSLEDFRLSTAQLEQARIVSHFFGTNERYVYGDANDVSEVETSHYEASLRQLYVAAGIQPFDSRSSTIEIIFDSQLSIASNLLAVILPRSYLLAHLELKVRFEHSGIRVDDYDSQKRFNVEGMYGVVLEHGIRVLRDSGFI